MELPRPSPTGIEVTGHWQSGHWQPKLHRGTAGGHWHTVGLGLGEHRPGGPATATARRTGRLVRTTRDRDGPAVSLRYDRPGPGAPSLAGWLGPAGLSDWQ